MHAGEFLFSNFVCEKIRYAQSELRKSLPRFALFVLCFVIVHESGQSIQDRRSFAIEDYYIFSKYGLSWERKDESTAYNTSELFTMAGEFAQEIHSAI